MREKNAHAAERALDAQRQRKIDEIAEINRNFHEFIGISSEDEMRAWLSKGKQST